jgi:hypothetical protein
MRAVFYWLVFGTVTVGVPLVAACGSEIDTHYGPPAGLRGSEFPSATATTTTTTTATTTTPEPDAGTPPPPTDGGVVTPVDGGTTQTISFANDIFPMMQPTGTWKCSQAGCHQNASAPSMDPNVASNTYNTLVAYKLLTNNQQYIVPGVNDPTKSGFDCNLKGTCGTAQMPSGTPAAAADIAKVDAWLSQGAPNN